MRAMQRLNQLDLRENAIVDLALKRMSIGELKAFIRLDEHELHKGNPCYRRFLELRHLVEKELQQNKSPYFM